MDATEKARDALQGTGQPSESKAQEPSTPPITYTEDQVRERHSKLDQKIDRLEKQGLGLISENASLKGQMKALQEEKDRAELETIRDDPPAYAIYQKQQQLKAKEAEHERKVAELAQREAEHADSIAEIQKTKTERLADRIAAEKGVDAKALLKFSSGTEESMRDLAQELPRKGVSTPLTPDSNRGSGGGLNLEGMSATDMIAEGHRREANKK